MALFELKELRRLGYGFGIRQAGLVVTVRRPAGGAPSRAASLVQRVRAGLSETVMGEAPAVGDPLPALELAAWALALQRRARIPLFDQPRLLGRRAVAEGAEDSRLLVPYLDMEAARSALDWAIGLANDFAAAGDEAAPLLDGIGARIEEAVGKLGERAPTGVNSYRICEAAFEERIPFGLFFRDIVVLGEGVKLKRMLSTITDVASPIGVSMARNKMQTAMALRQAGFPTVRHWLATSEDHAAQLAEKGGFPTVVKPADADGGAGVAAGLMTQDAVREAYRKALEVSSHVIVENFVHGHNYRVHVCNGRIVKTTLRRAGGVDGDGASSIRDLLARQLEGEQAQRRRLERGKVLLDLDDEARQMLAEVGMNEESVPAEGQFVQLRRRSNVSTGGTTTDVRGTLHPDNEAMLVRAAHLLGLDFAGIDFISPDISKSWLEVPSAICEINGQPQLGNDLNPKLYNELLREYMAGNGRIPWVFVLGGSGNQREARSLGEAIRAGLGKRRAPAVLAAADGVWIGASRVAGGPGLLASASEHVALGRFAAAAVAVGDPSMMATHGLATYELDFLVLGNDPHPSAKEFAQALDMIVPHVRKLAICEAGDPAIPALRAKIPASRLMLVLPASPNDAVRAHLAEGGHAVWIGDANEKGEATVVMGSARKTTVIGALRGVVGDSRRVRDLLIARAIEVQLPPRNRERQA